MRAERRSSAGRVGWRKCSETAREASLTTTAAGLLLLGGCVGLAGIDETSGDGLVGVSLSIERVSIGSTVVRAPQDLGQNTADYLIADELDPSGFSRFAATETEVGLWTADIFDATPPVLFDLPEPVGPVFPRLWTFPNQDLLASFEVLEHPDPTPIPDPATAMVTVNVTLDTGFTTDTYELFIVGAWNQVPLAAPATAGSTALMPAAFAASTMTSLSGRPLELFTEADTILIMRRLGTNLAGLLEVTPFDQTGNDMLSGTMIGVPQDVPLGLEIDPTAAMARLVTLPAVGAATFVWEVRAAPGHEAAIAAGPLLVSGIALVADTTVSVMYGNPFADRGWAAALTWSAQATRTATPAGQTLPVTLAAGMTQIVVDPAAGLALDYPAPVPNLISFNTTPLSADTLSVAAPVEPVEITFLTEDTDATLYGIDVFELVPNAAGTALEGKHVFNAVGLEARFTLSPDVFEVGKSYTIRAVTVVDGFPNVADGDLRTKTLPVALAFLDSGAFQVVP